MKHVVLPALALLISSTAQAGEPVSNVVELFTSQGCSSCPPANRAVAEAANAETLVLSYGVTYWDYLGWTDTFGDPAFTKRQKAYGRALGTTNIYTPQIVVNGAAHSPRLSRLSLEGDLARALSVEDGAVAGADGDDLVLVGYVPGQSSVAVARGENGGRTLDIFNVVRSVGPYAPGFERADGLEYAVLSHGDDMAVTGAVRLD